MISTIATARLILIPLGDVEVHQALDFFKRNRNHLRPWEPERHDDFYEEAAFRKRQEQGVQQMNEGKALRWFLVKKENPGRVIGSVNITNVIPLPCLSANLGYAMDGNEQGKGYITEAVISVCDFVAKSKVLHRLEAGYMPRNVASARVLEKAGFEKIGIAKKYLQINGVWEDHVLTQKIVY